MIALLLSSLAFAQLYEPHPCTGGDPTLKQEAAGERISMLGDLTGPGWGPAISSSHLPASGQAPAVGPEPDHDAVSDEALDAWLTAKEAYDEWTCTYASIRAVDGDPATAWVEGATGPGEGEVLFVALPKGAVEIWAGYGKSASLHAKNARPKEVEVILAGAGQPVYTQSAVMYSENPVLGRQKVVLQDVNGYQPLSLPDVPEGAEPAFLGIRILSVYPGEKWQDTCISEIRAAP